MGDLKFDKIPNTTRTTGAYAEVDNSRALSGTLANPHVVLIMGSKLATGTALDLELKAITNDQLSDGFFGPGSSLSRMCKMFKNNNENTELWAIAVSDDGAGVAASGYINITGSATGDGTVHFMAGGQAVNVAVTSGWSGVDVASAMIATINLSANSGLCLHASAIASTDALTIVANDKGAFTNQYDFRTNYFVDEGQVTPSGITLSLTPFAGGANNPDIGSVWAVIDNTHYHHIVTPYTDSANMTEIEDEMDERFGPLTDLQGHAWTGLRATQASATVFGNSRNGKHVTCPAFNNIPSNLDEIAASWAAQASASLNADPARPLTTLVLKGILPPPDVDVFAQEQRNVLLFDGIATYTEQAGKVQIDRSITMYQNNALGLPDPSYLDVQTLFTIMEIRFQWVARMVNRFIAQRFKLASDGFPHTPGDKVATPSIIKQEDIALFKDLQDAGLIEDLADFITNLKVERSTSDPNRVNHLLPPNLINQFRNSAGIIQFIL